jgi:magnesium chelatase family protein
LLDRIDMQIDVPALGVAALTTLPEGEASAVVRARVAAARAVQQARAAAMAPDDGAPPTGLNAHLQGRALDAVTQMTTSAKAMMDKAVEKWNLSARGYFRLLRVARSVADLGGGDSVLNDLHVAEALSYRRVRYGDLD